MKEICKQKFCTGCGACYAICPVSAINFVDSGFRGVFPSIDQSICIDCGRCIQVCPTHVPALKKSPEKAYAAYGRSISERASSASGGIASVLAENIVVNGGAVYGCVQESAAVICHKRIDTVEDLQALKGSKYVHSHCNDAYKSVRSDLDEGLRVMFVGTPCQVAGLKNYLGGKTEGLLTVDLCCHGVPSQSLLKSHLSDLGFVPEDCLVNFRRKDRGKIEYGLSVSSSADADSCWTPAYSDSYMTGFLSGMFFRENCFGCQYAERERCSDITLADYWGYKEGKDPQMTDRMGLSAVLINTESGMKAFESIMDKVCYEQCTVDETIRSNEQFRQPSVKPETYDAFMATCEQSGYSAACRKFMQGLKMTLWLRQIKSRYYAWPLRQYLRKKFKRIS